MCDIDLDFHKNVERRDLGNVNGDQTTVAVMDEEISVHCRGREVVHAASAVGDVTKDETFIDRGKFLEDIAKNEGVHEEAFRELEGYALGAGGADAPDGFVDFKVVIGGQEGDGGIESRIGTDGIWDLGFEEPLGADCGFLGFWGRELTGVEIIEGFSFTFHAVAIRVLGF